MTRILGIDPGSRITGFGVIDIEGIHVRYVASGCVRTDGETLAARLKTIFEGVGEIVTAHRPQVMAIEQVFMKHNVDSALKLGQARGAAICAGVMQSLPVYEYTPAQIKQAIVGKGNAAKAQVQHMVTALLKLPGAPQADAADALACALCHSHTSQTLQQIDKSLLSSRVRGRRAGRWR
ncbi:MAG: crossover junction endodeoxyribonuclease RuvC [Gammaproteobacteria bacterium]|nr:crossover junction endodeoxyribonuclease RuvC [Gammaproteobacteria bacterium]